jgi:hypothetical protein
VFFLVLTCHTVGLDDEDAENRRGMRVGIGDVQVRMGFPDFRRKIADFIIFNP